MNSTRHFIFSHALPALPLSLQVLTPDHIVEVPATARHPPKPTNESVSDNREYNDNVGDTVVDHCNDHDHHDAMIRVPVPGIWQYKSRNAAGSSNDESVAAEPTWRDASGTCAICLGQYVAGETVAWSSNALCEHCFHLECIEAWLHKQRTFALGALCPVCRRDFLVDPCFGDGDDNGSSLSCVGIVATSEGGEGESSPTPP
jgi:Ring finger domain